MESYRTLEEALESIGKLKRCQFCGNFITPDKHGYIRKYCDKFCRSKYEKKYLDTTYKYEKRCSICGKFFKTNRSKQKYCSKNCYSKEIQQNYKKQSSMNINIEGIKSSFLRIRWMVFHRDNFTCQYCGRNVREDKVKLEADHIIPKSKGGKTILSNLITACLECNKGKSDSLLDLRNKVERSFKQEAKN